MKFYGYLQLNLTKAEFISRFLKRLPSYEREKHEESLTTKYVATTS